MPSNLFLHGVISGDDFRHEGGGGRDLLINPLPVYVLKLAIIDQKSQIIVYSKSFTVNNYIFCVVKTKTKILSLLKAHTQMSWILPIFSNIQK